MGHRQQKSNWQISTLPYTTFFFINFINTRGLLEPSGPWFPQSPGPSHWSQGPLPPSWGPLLALVHAAHHKSKHIHFNWCFLAVWTEPEGPPSSSPHGGGTPGPSRKCDPLNICHFCFLLMGLFEIITGKAGEPVTITMVQARTGFMQTGMLYAYKTKIKKQAGMPCPLCV